MSRSLALAHRAARPVLLAARLSSFFAVARQRAQLAQLDANQLRDLGLTRHEADQEASRPFWDVPASWRD